MVKVKKHDPSHGKGIDSRFTRPKTVSNKDSIH